MLPNKTSYLLVASSCKRSFRLVRVSLPYFLYLSDKYFMPQIRFLWLHISLVRRVNGIFTRKIKMGWLLGGGCLISKFLDYQTTAHNKWKWEISRKASKDFRSYLLTGSTSSASANHYYLTAVLPFFRIFLISWLPQLRGQKVTNNTEQQNIL